MWPPSDPQSDVPEPPPAPPPVESRRGRAFWLAGGLAALIVTLAGAAVAASALRAPAAPDAAARRTVTSPDGTARVTVPAHWAPMRLNDAAGIQVGDAEAQVYLTVITEPRRDPAEPVEAVAARAVAAVRARAAGSRALQPESLTIGGHPAVRQEIRGTVNGLALTYWHTTVATRSRWHQIITWTLADRAPRHADPLRQITTTFRDPAP
ncbi:hypothetical protein [Bailinhaonella thermotolerans]|uniref:Uncharacterized protein n=1 Tax=Bailinhaonella thermotolerans TaxID=1070861 RepID=A0A3A4B7M5_9ACTN|nr:hypothetical protein [Bailinhaonella thermotolerans]RJL34231.1 hypothetical protein D5H75_07130 [Bailinhaonella thermotolerans]